MDLASILFLLVGIVNLLPVVGVTSAERLSRLYGVAVDGPDLAILLRHRAVLFGIVGALLVAAAFSPGLRSIAVAAGLLSMLSFVAIARLENGANAELRRVAWVDVAASVLLVIAAIL